MLCLECVGGRPGASVSDRRAEELLTDGRSPAKLTAILPRYPDRVPALLRKARVIDDPCRDRLVTFDPRQQRRRLNRLRIDGRR